MVGDLEIRGFWCFLFTSDAFVECMINYYLLWNIFIICTMALEVQLYYVHST